MLSRTHSGSMASGRAVMACKKFSSLFQVICTLTIQTNISYINVENIESVLLIYFAQTNVKWLYFEYGTFEFPQRLQNSGTLKGSCRTVALREFFLLTDRRATVPHVVKTVYLLRRKSCARFGLNFFIFLLCQVKIPDEKNTRHIYLLGKNINKHLVHFN